jgi:XTP/dITP diphosphohydrolase
MIGAGSTLLIATRNKGKTKEFREAFGKLGIAVQDLNEAEGIPDIEETGDTFSANALLKAKTVAELTGLPVLADDSGLCVDALKGAPGVYSARYSGENATAADNNAKLLKELEAIKAVASTEGEGEEAPKLSSSARFVSALVLYDPADGSYLEVEGTVEGFILGEARGVDGFGYDPLFWLPTHGKAMAELTVAEKNEISHRGAALRRLLEKLAQ